MGMIVRMMVVRRPIITISTRDRLGRGKDEPAGLDTLGADQVIGQVANQPRGAAQQDHFEAALFIEMDVSCRENPVEMVMLQISEPARNARGVVVVNEGDHAHCVTVVAGDLFFDERIAHQAADGLAPVRVAVQLAILIEAAEQLSADRHAESDERVFHGSVSSGAASAIHGQVRHSEAATGRRSLPAA